MAALAIFQWEMPSVVSFLEIELYCQPAHSQFTSSQARPERRGLSWRSILDWLVMAWTEGAPLLWSITLPSAAGPQSSPSCPRPQFHCCWKTTNTLLPDQLTQEWPIKGNELLYVIGVSHCHNLRIGLKARIWIFLQQELQFSFRDKSTFFKDKLWPPCLFYIYIFQNNLHWSDTFVLSVDKNKSKIASSGAVLGGV